MLEAWKSPPNDEESQSSVCNARARCDLLKRATNGFTRPNSRLNSPANQANTPSPISAGTQRAKQTHGIRVDISLAHAL